MDWLLLYAQRQIVHAFQYESLFIMNDDDDPCFVLDRHTEPDFQMLAHESNSQQEDMPLYPDSLFWHWANQSLL